MNHTENQTMEDSFDCIITKYSKMVYRLAFSIVKNKYDADDIYQEVFLRYIKNKPCFESEEHQKAWLIRVTINCSKSMLRSAFWRRHAQLEEYIPVVTKEHIDLLSELRKLPPKYSIVIHLFYYENMSIDEISKVIGKSPSAVKMRLVRARAMLKGFIKEEDYV